MAPTSTRRVSYVIPPSTAPPPRLKLPSLGALRYGNPSPILLHSNHEQSTIDHPNLKRASHPRHRLGVASLALDAATQLAGSPTPEGILYTGGRDGLLMSWELGVPMKARLHKYGASETRTALARHWEMMTGWADDSIDEEDDEEALRSDGDILGDVKESGGGRGRRNSVKTDDIPYEDRWESDLDVYKAGRPSHFRQCTQAHTDWVNDILLCNLNQTVISGSSDGTIKAWNPHSSLQSYPATIGSHADYVRCLAYGRERNWVASGSFDRTIKLWDVAQPRVDPLITLYPPESSGPKSSVYALAADPFGHIIASGSPERVVRTWDPRSGKRIGKLVGHTDNIRAILISEDSRYLLTGSADASIKLWSIVSPQRCLHTFTHHTDSVWSLFSSHPSLEIFYSGDRSGIVCKVDVEGCADIADGECVVVCKDTNEQSAAASEGVNKIIAMDDNLLWTASGSSSVKRWQAPARRIARGVYSGNMDSPESAYSPTLLQKSSQGVEVPRTPPRANTYEAGSPTRTTELSATPSLASSTVTNGSLHPQDADPNSTLFGIPFESLVRLASANDPFPSFAGMSQARDPEVATLYSAASIMSVPRQIARTPLSATFPPSHSYGTAPRSDTLSPPDAQYPAGRARADYEERDVAADARALCDTPDDVIAGENGLVRALILNDRMHALTVDTAGEVAVWDIVRAQCLGTFGREDVVGAGREGSASSESGVGGVGGERERSPRQALETVRERIEGEAVVLSWAQADTRIGELTIHLMDRWFEAEVFADEAGYGGDRQYNDESRLGIGKWVLRNLFLAFIREEQRFVLQGAYEEGQIQSMQHRDTQRSSPITPTPSSHVRAATEISSTLHSPGIGIIASPMTPAIVPEGAAHTPSNTFHPSTTNDGLSLISPLGSNDLTPMPNAPRAPVNTTDGPAPAPSHPPNASADYFSLRRRTSVSGGGPTPDDFSGWGGPGTAKLADGRPPTPSTPAGGFMGRLKNFGKSARRAASEVETPSAAGVLSTADSEVGIVPSPPKTFIQKLKAQSLTPPPASEAPPLSIPPNVSIIISEDSSSGWVPTYRGTVGSAGADVQRLEEAMPEWLLEYLLTNKAPAVPVTKVGFVLLPVPAKGGPDGGEQLPELLNSSQSKLSASRFLRVRKLTYHVQEKLDKLPASTTPITATTTPRSSTDIHTNAANSRPPSPTKLQSPDRRPRAEDVYEILCNDYVLPLDMTLAAVRQFVWRQAGELTMYYRRKITISALPTGGIKQQTGTGDGSSGKART